ncbi:replication factor C large subunit [Candidatus Woesearchaeota archaeon]|jgi:replication factor C large subunit|nr:replication factor C large subunit [Candidatus Woesearchaeota archaeon]
MSSEFKHDKPWILKHIPKNSSEVVGQDNSMAVLKDFIQNFKQQKRKAAFLYGPPGSGKTVSVHVLAKELSLEIMELNASDFRNKDAISKILGSAANQMSLFAKGKVILVDEVDGISGTRDRGGLNEVAKIMATSAFPIVFTGEDPYDKKFKSLRKNCEVLEFQALDNKSVSEVLKRIAVLEQIEYEEIALQGISRRSGGDLRAAINDLQMLSVGSGKKKLVKEDLDSLSDREQKESIQEGLLKIFKTTDFNVAITALNQVPEGLDQVMLWVDENLPKEYEQPHEIAKAYDYLSKADIMNRRIRRWQHWRFLIYVNAYLSAGVAMAKDKKYKKFLEYKPTMRLLKIWQANMKYQKRKAIAEKIAEKTHTSKRRVIKDVLPYVQEMMKHSPELKSSFASEFDLDREEVAWMIK